MLGDEEHEIDNPNSRFQTRMQGHALDELFIITIQPLHECHSFPAKLGQDIGNRVRIMIRFVRFAIRHVSRRQRIAAGFKVIEPSHSQ